MCSLSTAEMWKVRDNVLLVCYILYYAFHIYPYTLSHCKNYWHPSQTCDQARAKSIFPVPVVQTVRSSMQTDTDIDVMKACPRCGALIMKMNDGSCNHMQCALCNAEFCWLCLKQINELHYLRFLFAKRSYQMEYTHLQSNWLYILGEETMD